MTGKTLTLTGLVSAAADSAVAWAADRVGLTPSRPVEALAAGLLTAAAFAIAHDGVREALRNAWRRIWRGPTAA